MTWLEEVWDYGTEGLWEDIGDIGAEITGSADQTRAAEKAAEAQIASADAGIAEQRRQFDIMTELMNPYVTQGVTALASQSDLLGLNGVDAQLTAINNIESSPLFQAQVQAGEEAILQNASATGGLRGGNIQGALAQYRPQMLQQAIQNQYANLGGLTQLGQASAAGQAGLGLRGALGLEGRRAPRDRPLERRVRSGARARPVPTLPHIQRDHL